MKLCSVNDEADEPRAVSIPRQIQQFTRCYSPQNIANCFLKLCLYSNPFLGYVVFLVHLQYCITCKQAQLKGAPAPKILQTLSKVLTFLSTRLCANFELNTADHIYVEKCCHFAVISKNGVDSTPL